MTTRDLTKKLADKAGGSVVKKTKIESILTSESMQKQIKMAIPKHLTPERMVRIAITTYRKNANAFNKCDPMSFIAGVMQASQLGLEPNTPLGESYLIPYGNQVQFQLGYKGLLTLAYRTGEYRCIYARDVYADDEFDYSYGVGPDTSSYLTHRPADNPSGEPTHYYALYETKNGGYDFVVWSRAKVQKHAKKFSKAFGNGPWQTDFDAMAKKTVLIDLLKYAPKSIEFARAVGTDATVKTEISANMLDVDPEYEDVEPVDNIPNDAPAIDEGDRVDTETGELL